ncbi:MAG: ABC transporter substrate-binding protein [Alphaproteobacteria bacterium]
MKLHRRHTVRSLIVLVFGFFLFGSVAAKAEEPDAFIGRLADTAISSLTTGDVDLETRQERFRNLLRDGLNLDKMARVLLGPYRRRATEEQLKAFEVALEDYVVYTYAWRFEAYSGQKFETGRVMDGRRDSKIVESRLYPQNDAPPILVEWHVENIGGSWRIFDIVVENVSMVVTQKADFQSVLSSNNGSVEKLTEILINKNKKLASRSAS